MQTPFIKILVKRKLFICDPRGKLGYNQTARKQRRKGSYQSNERRPMSQSNAPSAFTPLSSPRRVPTFLFSRKIRGRCAPAADWTESRSLSRFPPPAQPAPFARAREPALYRINLLHCLFFHRHPPAARGAFTCRHFFSTHSSSNLLALYRLSLSSVGHAVAFALAAPTPSRPPPRSMEAARCQVTFMHDGAE